jgi:hypothetical protein
VKLDNWSRFVALRTLLKECLNQLELFCPLSGF